MPSTCRLCQQRAVQSLIDFGPQPITTYLNSSSTTEKLFPLELGQCRQCGLTQVLDATPVDELARPIPKIYSEPEHHLDAFAQRLAELPKLSFDDPIWGISYKDDTLLERLKRLGFRNIHRLDVEEDLGLDSTAGVEELQRSLTAEKAKEIVQRRGAPRLVVARHVFEHIHDLPEFHSAMECLAPSGAYLAVEVPDCEQAFIDGDCAVMWEEHVHYYTTATLCDNVERFDLKIVFHESYYYPFESSLVVIGLRDNQYESTQEPPAVEIEKEINLLNQFVARLETRHQQIRDQFAQIPEDAPIAIFGAGHLATMFINLVQLGDRIAFAVDDNPDKQGKFLPGSNIPVRSSDHLRSESVKHCLLAVRPEVEPRIAERQAEWLDGGGQFLSIFHGSPQSIDKWISNSTMNYPKE